MIKDVSLQVDKIVINTKARMLAVVKQSISEVVEEAQTPVAKGGRMRVKTGFLRSTGIGSLNAPSNGPNKGDPKGSYTWDGESINTILAKLNLGDVFYFGWTARYAKHREVKDGFLESALMNWQTHVNKAVQYFRNKDVRK